MFMRLLSSFLASIRPRLLSVNGSGASTRVGGGRESAGGGGGGSLSAPAGGDSESAAASAGATGIVAGHVGGGQDGHALVGCSEVRGLAEVDALGERHATRREGWWQGRGRRRILRGRVRR